MKLLHLPSIWFYIFFVSMESHSSPEFFVTLWLDYEPNFQYGTNRSLKQFHGITKPPSHFSSLFPYHSFYFKAKSNLSYNYQTEINKGFLAKYF